MIHIRHTEKLNFVAEVTLKLKFKAWKREAVTHKTPLKGSSLKIEILTYLSLKFTSATKLFFVIK